MLLSNIADIQAFNQKADGSYDNQETLAAFASAANSLKSTRTKLAAILSEFQTNYVGQAEAKISVLPKGADTPTQSTASAAQVTAFQAVITALQTAENACGAIDVPLS